MGDERVHKWGCRTHPYRFECRNCGHEFRAFRTDAVYCSSRCGKQYAKRTQFVRQPKKAKK